MKKQMLQLLVIIILVMGFSQVYAQWVVYDCSVLPETQAMGDSLWVEQDNTDGITDNGVSDLFSVIEDTEIADNKLVQVEDLVGDRKESFINNWAISDPSVGVTCVFRVKPSPGILAAQADDGNNYRYCYVSLRNGQYREEFRIDYPGVIDVNYIDQVVDFPTFDQWHVFRFTLKGDQVNIYIDEDPTPIVTGLTSKASDNNYIKIGDSSTGGLHGCLFDWVVWDKSGAYAPGEGTALPSELTGLATSVADNGTALPVSHQLMQNYPNPFNPTTEISFNVGSMEHVSLNVYDVNGKLVRNLVNDTRNSGSYRVTWDGLNNNGQIVAAGIYFNQLRIGNAQFVNKMTLIK